MSFSIAAALLAPQALGQVYTTVTGQTTTESQLVYTETQSSADSSHTSNTIIQEPIVSELLTQTGYVSGCAWRSFSFLTATGEALSGEIPVDEPNTLIVFIISDNDYNLWIQPSNNYCDPTFSGNVVVQWSQGSNELALTRIDVSWTAPSAGRFWLVIETNSYVADIVTANISIQKSYQNAIAVYSTSFLTGTSDIAQVMATQTVEYASSFYEIVTGMIVLFLSALLCLGLYKARKRGTSFDMRQTNMM
jgi:hypothetical protein